MSAFNDSGRSSRPDRAILNGCFRPIPDIQDSSFGISRRMDAQFSQVLGSIKPFFIFGHPLLHVLLTVTRIIHYVSMSLHVMRPKCFHPFFECFTFRCNFAHVAFKCFHSIPHLLFCAGRFGSLAVVYQPITRMSAFERIAVNQNESSLAVRPERPLSPIAVIQVAQIKRFSTTAYGQERTFWPIPAHCLVSGVKWI